MKNLLSEFEKYFEKQEEFRRRLINYSRMLESEEFSFFKDALLTMKGIMATDMLESRQFTSLDPVEKDVTQKTYHNIDQMLTFLSDPLKWIKRQGGRWDMLKEALKIKSGGMKNG